MAQLPEKTITLEDVLLEAYILTEEQYDELKEELRNNENFTIEKAIIERKLAKPTEIELAKESIQKGIPCISLADRTEDKSAVAKITPTFAFKNRIAPVSLEDDVLTVAMSDPLDIMLIDEIRLVTECEVRPLLANQTIMLVLNSCSPSNDCMGAGQIRMALRADAELFVDINGDLDHHRHVSCARFNALSRHQSLAHGSARHRTQVETSRSGRRRMAF